MTTGWLVQGSLAMAAVMPVVDPAASGKSAVTARVVSQDLTSALSCPTVDVRDLPEYVGVNTSCSYLIERMDAAVEFNFTRAVRV